MSGQNQVILNQLRKCDRKAAIVPVTVALQMETILQKSHSSESVYVGKNIIFQSRTDFLLLS